jgi:tetratricopeptide (TPR) repeat protein
MRSDLERARELVDRARAAERRGEAAKALGLYDDALALFEPDTVDPFLADVLRWKGTLLRERGETEAAYRNYNQSLVHATAVGATVGEAHALNCLGIIAQRRGDPKEAERLYERAASLAEICGETRLVGMIEQNRGVLADTRGDYAHAAVCYSNSRGAFEASGDNEALSWVLNNLGMLHTKIKNFGDARHYLERALAIAKEREDATVVSVATLNMAELWLALGWLELSDEWCARALEDSVRRGDHLTAAGALKCRARIERERGALDKSIATLRIALYEAEGAEDHLLHAELLRELGEISRALGNAGAARSAWREAAASFKVIGATHQATSLTSEIESLPS